MRTGAIQQLRAILRCHPEGLTTTALSDMIGSERSNVGKYLQSMPDAYIDRWEKAKRGAYKAVWCIVEVPDDCPHPTRKMVAVRQSRLKDFAVDAPSNRAANYTNN